MRTVYAFSLLYTHSFSFCLTDVLFKHDVIDPGLLKEKHADVCCEAFIALTAGDFVLLKLTWKLVKF